MGTFTILLVVACLSSGISTSEVQGPVDLQSEPSPRNFGFVCRVICGRSTDSIHEENSTQLLSAEEMKISPRALCRVCPKRPRPQPPSNTTPTSTTPQQTTSSTPQQTTSSTPQQTTSSTPQQTTSSTPQQTTSSTPQQPSA